MTTANNSQGDGAAGTLVTIFLPDGGGVLQYESVVDYKSNGIEIELTLADGTHIASNCRYHVQEPPENQENS